MLQSRARLTAFPGAFPVLGAPAKHWNIHWNWKNVLHAWNSCPSSISKCLFYDTKQIGMGTNIYSREPVKCGGENLIVFHTGLCYIMRFLTNKKNTHRIGETSLMWTENLNLLMEDIFNLHKTPILISISLGNNYPIKSCPQWQITTLLNTLKILSKDSVIIPVSKCLLQDMYVEMYNNVLFRQHGRARGAAGPQKQIEPEIAMLPGDTAVHLSVWASCSPTAGHPLSHNSRHGHLVSISPDHLGHQS